MKAKELMYGDIVLIEGTPRIVSQITKHKIGYHRTELPFGECKMSYTRLCEVSPIPLTKEILEKNGFKKRGDEYVFFEWDGAKQWYVSLEDFKPQFDFWFITSSDRDLNVRGKIRYVHELQHALRLCGLDELANNLKVVEG